MAMITKHTPAATPPAIGAASDFLGESIKAAAVVDGAAGVVDGAASIVDVVVPAVVVDGKFIEVLDPVGL
jgi:hypothetical protein